MRRVIAILSIILLLALPVSAFSGITTARNNTTVASDGSCQVTLSISVQLDSMPASLVFPVPASATGITVSGISVSAPYSGGVRNIDLTSFITYAGTHNLVICYTLPNVVDGTSEALILTLPLLCGFEYPVDELTFSVTLPGQISHNPSFTSTYYPDAIETMMTVRVDGATISGSVEQRLQDHETLTMALVVEADMFPSSAEQKWSLDTTDLVTLIIAGIALAYWLLTMRGLPPRPVRRTVAPDGITAGQIGCRLSKQGVDFTMMVLSWAQMGYILIQPDDNGRVLLHKRMDMGNERSEFENRAFRNLFGKRRVVDGTGYHYALACRKAAGSIPGIQDDFLNHTGSPHILRFLATAVGAVNGISLAIGLTADTGWRVVLAIFLAIAGCAAAWLLQSAGKALYSRHRLPALLALAAAMVWFVLGYAAGEWHLALIVIVYEILAGLGALFGGSRTESGKQTVAEILGLRKYLKNLSSDDWKRILRNNPHYFYDLAPYAMALGIDRKFARQLKQLRLPSCPYLTTGMDGHLTAAEWNQLLRETVNALDALQKRLPLDRLLGR